MTASETRLGLKIFGPDVNEIKTSGLVEVDFYGGGAENSPQPRIRHAYMKLEWPEQRLSLLAGQTWDVISPLNPSTLNYTVQWWGGNIGMRRPQIRVTKGLSISDDTDLTLQAALLRQRQCAPRAALVHHRPSERVVGLGKVWTVANGLSQVLRRGLENTGKSWRSRCSAMRQIKLKVF